MVSWFSKRFCRRRFNFGKGVRKPIHLEIQVVPLAHLEIEVVLLVHSKIEVVP